MGMNSRQLPVCGQARHPNQISVLPFLLSNDPDASYLLGQITPPGGIGIGNHPIHYRWGSRALLGGGDLGRTHQPWLQDMPCFRGRAAQMRSDTEPAFIHIPPTAHRQASDSEPVLWEATDEQTAARHNNANRCKTRVASVADIYVEFTRKACETRRIIPAASSCCGSSIPGLPKFSIGVRSPSQN